MLFVGWEVRIGKSHAQGLEYGGQGPYLRLRAQFFPILTYQGQQTMCLFFCYGIALKTTLLLNFD